MEKNVKSKIGADSASATQAKTKATKPKKIKPLAKPKKVKPKKEKVIKPKLQKPKKVKKPKKPKTLKQKLIKLGSILIIATLCIFSVGSVFTSNDFAMTLVFSQNAEKTLNVVEKARQQVFDAPYIDMVMTFQAKNIETGQLGDKNTIEIKMVHYANTNTYEYASKITFSYMPNIVFENHYLDGILYQKVLDNGNVVQKQKSTIALAQQTFSSMWLYDENALKLLVPTSANPIIDPALITSQKTSLILPLSPIYVGEQITVNYEQNRQEIYKLNHKGHLKERSYTITMGNSAYVITAKYRSLNKIFTLPIPSDLNTYL